MTSRMSLLVPLSLFFGASLLLSQSTTGTIQGLVVDQQKALVPGVTVTVRNLETNATRTGISNDEGRYRVPNLPVGTYEVRAELGGFAKYVQSGVTLSLNQAAVVDVTLRPAGGTDAGRVFEAHAPPPKPNHPPAGVPFHSRHVSP